MPRKGYKSITLPEPTYQMVVEIRKEIAQKGLGSIPKEIRELVEADECPRCKIKMDKIELRAGYYRCSRCGFEKPEIRLNATGSFAVGAIAGILLTLGLMYLLKRMR
jgi:hypothetical protein